MVEAAAADAADLAERVARGAAKLFDIGIYVTIHARTLDELRTVTAGVKSAAASVLLDLQPATFRHHQGWISTLPIGVDPLRMRRILDTTALAAAFPLASADLAAPAPGTVAAPEGVLYGVNTTSNGVVMWDRWAQDNHNSVVLARSGAGQVVLRQAGGPAQPLPGHVRVRHRPRRRVRAPGRAVGGTVVQLGQPGVRVNPLDLPADDRARHPDPPRPVPAHPDRGHARRSHRRRPNAPRWTGRSSPPTARAGITADPATWTRPAPLLRDLADTLAADDDPAAGQLAARLAPWTVGQLRQPVRRADHHPSRDGHLVVWSLRHLPDELRTVGTLLALDSIWRASTPPPHRPPAAAAGRGRRGVAADARRRRRRVPVPDGQGSPQTHRRPVRHHPGRRRRAVAPTSAWPWCPTPPPRC